MLSCPLHDWHSLLKTHCRTFFLKLLTLTCFFCGGGEKELPISKLVALSNICLFESYDINLNLFSLQVAGMCVSVGPHIAMETGVDVLLCTIQ